MDIVERLRCYRPTYGWPEERSVIIEPTMNHVAADEIVWLREALKKICHVTGSDMEAYDIAKNALKEKE